MDLDGERRWRRGGERLWLCVSTLDGCLRRLGRGDGDLEYDLDRLRASRAEDWSFRPLITGVLDLDGERLVRISGESSRR